MSCYVETYFEVGVNYGPKGKGVIPTLQDTNLNFTGVHPFPQKYHIKKSSEVQKYNKNKCNLANIKTNTIVIIYTEVAAHYLYIPFIKEVLVLSRLLIQVVILDFK